MALCAKLDNEKLVFESDMLQHMNDTDTNDTASIGARFAADMHAGVPVILTVGDIVIEGTQHLDGSFDSASHLAVENAIKLHFVHGEVPQVIRSYGGSKEKG